MVAEGQVELAAWVARLQGPDALRQRILDEMLALADTAEATTRRLIAERLTVRSRQLLTSTRAQLEVEPDVLTLRVRVGGDYEGLRVPYARIQEEGGAVKARGKALAIPVGPALTGDPGREVPRAPSPRLVPRLRWAPAAKRGNTVGLLVNRDTGAVWFVLVRQVRISPKHYARDAAAEVAARVPAALRPALEGL